MWNFIVSSIHKLEMSNFWLKSASIIHSFDISKQMNTNILISFEMDRHIKRYFSKASTEKDLCI